MKKAFFTAILSVLLVSCTVDYGTDFGRTAGNLENIAVDLVEISVVFPVNFLCDNSVPEDIVNEVGFSYGVSVDYGLGSDVEYLIEQAADNLWNVTVSGKMFDGGFQISREAGSTGNGESWRVSPFEMDYDEGNGYSALLATEEDVIFDWEYSSYLLSSPTWSLEQSGKYFLNTFIDGKSADSAVLEYTCGRLRFSGGPDC